MTEKSAATGASHASNGSNKPGGRTRSVAFVGLCVAIMAVSAWITVPLGPVPFTLQIFAMVFAILVLPPKESVASIAIYLLMGAVGLPVFSSMRGGIGVLLGPTGGFLWGYLLGAFAAVGILKLLGSADGRRPLAVDVAASALFLAVCYVCGWFQLAVVTQMGLSAAFAAGVAPFVLIDVAKIVAATLVARSVRRAVRR